MYRPASRGNLLIGIAVVLVLALIGCRLYLPIWATHYVNRQINALGEYSGGVDDIDLHLWRGAYTIHGLEIRKKDAGDEHPFVAADTIDLSVEWPALIRGALVAEIDLYNARLNFSKLQDGTGAGWGSFVETLTPLSINRLEIHDSEILYTDYTAKPALSLFVNDLNASVINLRQVEQTQDRLPSDATISGQSIGDGRLEVSAKMNILKDVPDFDINFSLKEAQLNGANDYLEHLAKVAFKQGNLSVFAEFAAADGHLTGYVKPVADSIEIAEPRADEQLLTTIWRSIASFFIFAFKNHPEDQFAMRIPIEGTLDKPDQDLWSTFISIFSNAFGKAFTKNEDGTISFNDALRENKSEAAD